MALQSFLLKILTPSLIKHNLVRHSLLCWCHSFCSIQSQLLGMISALSIMHCEKDVWRKLTRIGASNWTWLDVSYCTPSHILLISLLFFNDHSIVMDQSVRLWFLDSVYFIFYLLDRRYIGWYQYTHGLYSWFCLIWGYHESQRNTSKYSCSKDCWI